MLCKVRRLYGPYKRRPSLPSKYHAVDLCVYDALYVGSYIFTFIS